MDKYRKELWCKVFYVVEWLILSEIGHTERLRKGYNDEGLKKDATEYLEKLSATYGEITELRDSWEKISDE